MPLSKYFSGHGKEVMSKMKGKYGDKKGESVFYATANKRGMGSLKSHGTKGKSKKKSLFSKGK